ncbi:MAG: histidine triad nucleotide-binding protein [Deltaproteobacteria bacterium]|nr:histidine triad nucleotide-binding protein [Deltaproteobacteria bacterium]
MDCIFCKMAARAIKVDPVVETDRVMVVKDINPQAPVHLLVIPKTHYASILECKDMGVLGEMMEAAVTSAKKLGVADPGFRLSINTNDEGGQTVFHLHMHLLAGRPLSGRLG